MSEWVTSMRGLRHGYTITSRTPPILKRRWVRWDKIIKKRPENDKSAVSGTFFNYYSVP